MLDEAYRRHPGRVTTTTTLARLLAAAPDQAVRDGGRAFLLATDAFNADAAPVHAETVALALAELGRCAEAAEWMRRAVASAERSADAAEAARLKGELPRYEAASCRR